jgi:hypothetical protein
MSKVASIVGIWFLVLCLVAIGLTLGNYNTASVTLDGELYAELGIVSSRVHYKGQITRVTLNDYNLPTNATTGAWGGPWFVNTRFHTWMSLATASVAVVFLFTCVQLGLVIHHLRFPDFKLSAVVFLTAINIIVLVATAVGVSSMFQQKISGVKPVPEWGVAGVSSIFSLQIFFGLLLCCM